MSFLKVKRKCEEDPKEIFVFASKKFKLQDISDNVPIFQLASPAVKEENVNNVIVETLKNRTVKSPKCDLEKLRTRMREDNRERIKGSRYRLHAAMRELDDETLEQKKVPVINVQDGASTEDENANEWVYDIYYSSDNVDVTEMSSEEGHFLADPHTNYFVDEVQTDSENEQAPDDDDSNDENNWRNDYPDEESSDSDEGNESDDSLSRKMRKARIDSDDSLSSADFYDYEYPDSYAYHDKVMGSDSSDEDD